MCVVEMHFIIIASFRVCFKTLNLYNIKLSTGKYLCDSSYVAFLGECTKTTSHFLQKVQGAQAAQGNAVQEVQGAY